MNIEEENYPELPCKMLFMDKFPCENPEKHYYGGNCYANTPHGRMSCYRGMFGWAYCPEKDSTS